MENKNTSPIELARELGFSIIDSIQYRNLKKLEEEMQNETENDITIQNYLQAKKDYEKLLKNVYNIIEYMTGETRLISSSDGCCGKCHSNCSGCAK
ncbi:hypothetical protein [Proteiniborus sp. MB09-C3]|uniref:hypothetical protein n=1 Tax=Proteiniborus sp. MB09-C3 TaxID=3050072 RepID=UPI002554E0C5|nr:hypothetical protein [Proteiniborus sp. MB09-C3]WIV10940.1 hypothetical protein QO263_12340 [Proteiniborus sp. MB09-C3]